MEESRKERLVALMALLPSRKPPLNTPHLDEDEPDTVTYRSSLNLEAFPFHSGSPQHANTALPDLLHREGLIVTGDAELKKH